MFIKREISEETKTPLGYFFKCLLITFYLKNAKCYQNKNWVGGYEKWFQTKRWSLIVFCFFFRISFVTREWSIGQIWNFRYCKWYCLPGRKSWIPNPNHLFIKLPNGWDANSQFVSRKEKSWNYSEVAYRTFCDLG